MADHGSPIESPAPIRRAKAVIDLRHEPAVRHRPTRGVPREPDARMRAYRDRPLRPSPTGGPRRTAPLEVTEVPDRASDEPGEDDAGEDATGKDGTRRTETTDQATEVAMSAPIDHVDNADDADDAAVTDVGRRREPSPSPSSYEGSDGRKRLLMGQLVVKRLRLRSVWKVAFTFYLCLFAVVATAGAILWSLANREGWVTGWTGFLVDIGFTDAAVDGATLGRASAAVGAILVLTATMLTLAAAFFYNQLSGLVGGVEITVVSPKRGSRVGRRHHRGRRHATH